MTSLVIPQKKKFKKIIRKVCFNTNGLSGRSNKIYKNCNYGLVSLSGGVMTLKQIQTCYKVILKVIKVKRLKKKKKQKKIVRLISSLFLSVPLTKKSLGIRMGKGKGSIEDWAFPIKKNRILFQLKAFVRPDLAYLALKQTQYRIPFKTKLIFRFFNSFKFEAMKFKERNFDI